MGRKVPHGVSGGRAQTGRENTGREDTDETSTIIEGGLTFKAIFFWLIGMVESFLLCVLSKILSFGKWLLCASVLIAVALTLLSLLFGTRAHECQLCHETKKPCFSVKIKSKKGFDAKEAVTNVGKWVSDSVCQSWKGRQIHIDFKAFPFTHSKAKQYYVCGDCYPDVRRLFEPGWGMG